MQLSETNEKRREVVKIIEAKIEDRTKGLKDLLKKIQDRDSWYGEAWWTFDDDYIRRYNSNMRARIKTPDYISYNFGDILTERVSKLEEIWAETFNERLVPERHRIFPSEKINPLVVGVDYEWWQKILKRKMNETEYFDYIEGRLPIARLAVRSGGVNPHPKTKITDKFIEKAERHGFVMKGDYKFYITNYSKNNVEK